MENEKSKCKRSVSKDVVDNEDLDLKKKENATGECGAADSKGDASSSCKPRCGSKKVKE